MRILYHHRIRSKDGQFVHLEEMVNALRRAGHQVRISGPPIVETASFGSDAGAVRWLKRLLPRALYELMELMYSVRDYLRLRQDIREYEPDVIYERYNLYFVSGVWARQRFGLPLLLEVNAPLYSERLTYGGLGLKRMARWSELFAWRNADHIFAVTGVLAGIIRDSACVPERRLTVTPNAINADTFADPPEQAVAKAQLGICANAVIGFVGFVREWHRLDRVVDMLPRLPGTHLLIVGDGPAVPLLQEQVAAMGLGHRVTFAGLVDRQDVARHIAAFDIALQPDVVEYASPLKIFEYLMMGKPVVGPRSANIEEILEDGENALLFDAASDDEFFEAVRRLTEDDDLRRAMSVAAGETLSKRNISWDANAKKVVDTADALLH